MKNVLLYGFLITTMFISLLGFGSVRKTAITRQEYKRALDAGADAAAKHNTYISEEDLDGLSYGFGEGYEHKNNIRVNKQDSIDWFYKVFFRNIGIEDRPVLQEKLKQYITMKCIIEFDRLSIANEKDEWIIEKQFIIDYKGKDYLFTLSNQIKDLETNTWITETDLGLDTQARKTLVSTFIENEIESFINNDANINNDNYYTLNLGLNDYDFRVNTVNGSNVIIFVEGMPIPSLNVFDPYKKLYAFTLGGSEITRK